MSRDSRGICSDLLVIFASTVILDHASRKANRRGSDSAAGSAMLPWSTMSSTISGDKAANRKMRAAYLKFSLASEASCWME